MHEELVGSLLVEEHGVVVVVVLGVGRGRPGQAAGAGGVLAQQVVDLVEVGVADRVFGTVALQDSSNAVAVDSVALVVEPDLLDGEI